MITMPQDYNGALSGQKNDLAHHYTGFEGCWVVVETSFLGGKFGGVGEMVYICELLGLNVTSAYHGTCQVYAGAGGSDDQERF